MLTHLRFAYSILPSFVIFVKFFVVLMSKKSTQLPQIQVQIHWEEFQEAKENQKRVTKASLAVETRAGYAVDEAFESKGLIGN